MEAGVDPTNFRLAAYPLVNSANIIYGCLHTRIETTFCHLSALCNWVTKETLLFNGRSHTRREVRLSIVWACIVWSNWRMLARRRHLLAGVHRCRTIDWLIDWLIDSNKGLMCSVWARNWKRWDTCLTKLKKVRHVSPSWDTCIL